MIRGILFLALVLLTPAGASAQEQRYLISPGDRLDISVLEDPSLNRVVLVQPDGLITLPLAGSILAEGLSPEAVATRVRRALASDFIQPPTVTVSLVALGGAQQEAAEAAMLGSIYVLGQVAQPGVFQLPLPISLLQALAIAGGPNPFAAESRIHVRRREAGSEVVITFDYAAIEAGVVPSNHIVLRDGDVIVVPQRGLFE